MEQELLNGEPVKAPPENRVETSASITDDDTRIKNPPFVLFNLGHASAVPCLPSDLDAVPREDWVAFWCHMDYQRRVVQRCDFAVVLFTYALLGSLVALLIFAHSAVHIGHCAAVMLVAALTGGVLDTAKNTMLLQGIQEACRHEQQVFQKYGFSLVVTYEWSLDDTDGKTNGYEYRIYFFPVATLASKERGLFKLEDIWADQRDAKLFVPHS
jgi:hypothetical protein